jgi:TRAP-type C4-dicarboxylate transport system substrate-binding protein
MKSIHAAIVCGAMLITAQTTAFAAELRMLKGWSGAYTPVKLADAYAENITKASGGRITVRMSGPEVVPPFEQLQPVSTGVFQLLFTHPAYHTGTSGIALALEAIDNDSKKRRDTGVWNAIDQYYRKHNLKLIALPTSGPRGFNFILRRPLAGEGLKGLKIRGTPIYQPLIDSLGGSAVVLPGGDIYSALEKGVIDGAAWPVFGIEPFKWNEVAKFIARPAWGAVSHQLFMNLDAFNKLDAKDKKIIEDEGVRIEPFATEFMTKLAADEEKLLLSKGMQITRFTESQGKAIDENWAKGVWALAEKISGDDARKLHALAKKHNMTSY